MTPISVKAYDVLKYIAAEAAGGVSFLDEYMFVLKYQQARHALILGLVDKLLELYRSRTSSVILTLPIGSRHFQQSYGFRAA